MRGFLVITTLLLLGGAMAYTLADCKAIENEITNIESQKGEYSKLTIYAMYSKLGDKYGQLAECYQDVGLPYKGYYSNAGSYYEKAGDAYVTEPKKQYEYYLSSGDMYGLAGEQENAFRAYQKAKIILQTNPDLNINPAYVNQRLVEIKNPIGIKPSTESKMPNIIPWLIGGLVLFGVVLTFYYILKKY